MQKIFEECDFDFKMGLSVLESEGARIISIDGHQLYFIDSTDKKTLRFVAAELYQTHKIKPHPQNQWVDSGSGRSPIV